MFAIKSGFLRRLFALRSIKYGINRSSNLCSTMANCDIVILSPTRVKSMSEYGLYVPRAREP